MNTNSIEAIVIDTETTGFKANEVIEVAFIALENLDSYPGNSLILQSKNHHKFEQRYKPKTVIEYGAQRLHGISMSDVAHCPSFSAKELPIPTSAKFIIGHNISYDLRALNGKFSDFDFAEHFQLLPICTLKLARKLWPDLKSKKLVDIVNTNYPDVAQALIKDAHAAMRDSLLTLLILHDIVEQYECKSWKDVYDLQS